MLGCLAGCDLSWGYFPDSSPLMAESLGTAGNSAGVRLCSFGNFDGVVVSENNDDSPEVDLFK